ncbi:hypothetical protein T265_05949 [Opisthorchis viverrini]|uniref:Calpain family cysteine protease n=1 Tax=Opisthorchis viverrini TaxID=6198 RepID=A0A074ZM92_OPIVI|nr:hypothetical protein T265_05949 [Opisthorchis viverrini]KER26892.1 hypothetical protein T265_05949 [Opisthorchis viverrini]
MKTENRMEPGLGLNLGGPPLREDCTTHEESFPEMFMPEEPVEKTAGVGNVQDDQLVPSTTYFTKAQARKMNDFLSGTKLSFKSNLNSVITTVGAEVLNTLITGDSRHYRSGMIFKFPRFEDPRIALRKAKDNKVVLPFDAGETAKKPVPVTRGGALASTTQSYDELKAQLLQQGRLFEDPEFPPVDSSLYYSQPPPRPIQWLRPHVSIMCISSRIHLNNFGRDMPINHLDVFPPQRLCGSYEALKGGTTSEALEDFTGGIAEMFELRSKCPPDLFKIMLKSQERCSLMACSIQADPNRYEARLPNGLIMGHAYSVTSVKMIDTSTAHQVALVRVRNPWGDEAEWKGAWSDKSPEWNQIPAETRKLVGLTFEDDGEFWMSYKDFISNFEKLEICHLGPQSLGGAGELPGRKWEMCIEHGSWIPRVSAGGCRNFLETFWINPQFSVNLVDPDEDDDVNEGTMIVGLMQKHRRKLRKQGEDLLTIGYAIYALPESHSGTLDMNFFKYNASKARSPAFINLREVCGRHKLPPGRYAIIPSTFQPNEEAEFMLRIFTEHPQTSEEIDDAVAAADTSALIQPLNEAQVEALKRAFTKVAGVDGEIDSEELRDILNVAFTRDFKFDGFTLESCRSMISMMDFDRSGMLNFDEFKTLWNLLRLWKTAFKKFDVDKSGCMNSFELRNALKAVGADHDDLRFAAIAHTHLSSVTVALLLCIPRPNSIAPQRNLNFTQLCITSPGFSINNSIFNTLVMRFARRDGSIAFDDYVICCARLQTLFEIFKASPKTTEGRAIFDETNVAEKSSTAHGRFCPSLSSSARRSPLVSINPMLYLSPNRTNLANFTHLHTTLVFTGDSPETQLKNIINERFG